MLVAMKHYADFAQLHLYNINAICQKVICSVSLKAAPSTTQLHVSNTCRDLDLTPATEQFGTVTICLCT